MTIIPRLRTQILVRIGIVCFSMIYYSTFILTFLFILWLYTKSKTRHIWDLIDNNWLDIFTFSLILNVAEYSKFSVQTPSLFPMVVTGTITSNPFKSEHNKKKKKKNHNTVFSREQFEADHYRGYNICKTQCFSNKYLIIIGGSWPSYLLKVLYDNNQRR